MATRARIVKNIPALVTRLGDMQTIFNRIKDAQDQIVYVDDNALLPITVTDAQRQAWKQAFDQEAAAVIAEVEAWKA